MTFAFVPPLLFALAAQATPAAEAQPAESEPAAPQPASSQQSVVVVATGRTPAFDAVAAEAEVLVRLKLRERAGVAVVNATAPQRIPGAVLEEALALVEEGEDAYAELETKKAVRDLERAVKLLQAELDRTGERKLLVTALSLLGSVHNQSGHPDKAERAFLKLLALAPTHSLDEGRFPPADVKMMQRLQEDLAFTEPGTLKISSGEVPASVWLDGRFRGITPLVLENVEPGHHVWLVRRQGYRSDSGSISVRGGGPGVVKARLAAPTSDPELPRRIQSLVLERVNLHPTLFALGDALGKPDELLGIVVEEGEEGPVLKVVRALVPGAVLVGYREVPAGEGWQDRLDVAVTELLDAPTTAELPKPAVAAASPPAEEVSAEDAEGDSGTGVWIAGATGGLLISAVLVGGAALAFVGLTTASGAEPTTTAANDPHALARRRVVLGF